MIEGIHEKGVLKGSFYISTEECINAGPFDFGNLQNLNYY